MPSFKMSPTPFSFTFLACPPLPQVLLRFHWSPLPFCISLTYWFLAGYMFLLILLDVSHQFVMMGIASLSPFFSWLKDAPRRTPSSSCQQKFKKPIFYFTNLLYSTLCLLLYSTLTLVYFYSFLYFTELCCPLFYFTLLYHILPYFILYFTVLYLTLLYSTLPLLYSNLLKCTLFTLLYFAFLYFTVLNSAVLYSTPLLFFTLLYRTLFYYTLLWCTLLYFTLPYFTLLWSNFTLLYLCPTVI